MTRVFVFPGQRSQAVGMGRALHETFAFAREVFEEVDDALGQRVTKLMFEGPEGELTPDGERSASADVGQPRGHARTGARQIPSFKAMPPVMALPISR